MVVAYKIDTWKSIAFLYISNEIPETVKKRNPIKTCLGINLTKEVKSLYAENYETLIKEIKDDSKKRDDIP